MKIKTIILENFRSFYGKVKIPVDDFTAFLGKNDQGKTSIFEAIDIFINEGKKDGLVKICNNDLNFIAKNEGIEEFKIGIVFKDFFTKFIIDASNSTLLKDEYLLNDDGFLEIWKVFKNGKIKETFIKCKHPVNDNFLKNLMNKKIKELQNFAKEKDIDTSKIDTRKSADLRAVIREYYKKRDGNLNLDEIEIKIDAEGLKDIWSKLQNYLPIYGLFYSDRKNVEQDSEIQDPLKMKIDLFFKREEIQNKLNDIAQEINNEINEISDNIIQKFQEVSKQAINIYPNIPKATSLKWKDVYKGIGFNTDNDIPLNKRGSGIRRMVLMSSFLADVEQNTKNSKDGDIVYAIEEPETSMHPNLQKNLIEALKELSKSKGYQIFISTHSPALMRLLETSSIRYVEQDKNGKSQINFFNDDVAKKIVENLGILPNIGKVVVCVEGENDENFLLNINQGINELKNIIDLKSGLLAIIPLRGSNLKNWINRYILQNTNAIEFHLYDKDSDNKYEKDIERVKGRKDGSCGFLTKKREIENYIHREIIEEEFGINLDNIHNWDETDIPKEIFNKLPKKMKETDIKERLCGSCSKRITKRHLEELNAWDEVEGWFKKIKELVDKVSL